MPLNNPPSLQAAAGSSSNALTSSGRIGGITLEVVLRDPVLLKLFQEWTSQNLCSENLDFWFDADNFKNIDDKDQMQHEARRIFQRYVREKAQCQINLDFETREVLEEKIKTQISRDMFLHAQHIIFEAMKYDSLTKFMDSDSYREWRGLGPRSNKSKSYRRNKHTPSEMPNIRQDAIMVLDHCLRDEVGREEFLKFCKTEYSDGSLLFYIDVQRYKQNPSIETGTQIYNQFLDAESSNEVDSDPRIRKNLWKALQEGDLNGATENYDRLASQVYAVMAQDSFFRFQMYMLTRLSVI